MRQSNINAWPVNLYLFRSFVSYLPTIAWQLFEHVFLEGFLPPIALAMQVIFIFDFSFLAIQCILQAAAYKAPSELLGPSGAPNPSAFSTFAYCAGAHVDNDDSPTIGRVLRRDPTRVSLPFTCNISLI